ncbi:Hypothetical predicted protein [Pelobates cultripes]|uniref:Uncharacterized protein n=1 Tax=Pelobates cultripes TaxID=61616 RepID=A0AAD1VNL7_PELCU|nr:Hypothetical predicted protein [Pelobates cultripes]
MDYDAPPLDGMCSEDQVMSECPEPMAATMTTSPIIQSTEKRKVPGKNTAKPPFCTLALKKPAMVLSYQKEKSGIMKPSGNQWRLWMENPLRTPVIKSQPALPLNP